MKIIELTADEAMAAGTVGVMQILRKIQMGRKGDHGGVSRRGIRERWGDTINGLMGEQAACKALGRTWMPGARAVSYGECAGYEVRTAFDPGDGLLIYKSDPDDKVFVFVRGSFPRFEVYPPIVAAEAKALGDWKEKFDPACWRVDPRKLIGIKAKPVNGSINGTPLGAEQAPTLANVPGVTLPAPQQWSHRPRRIPRLG